MSPFFSLVFSIFLASGFHLFGEIIIKLFRFQNIIKKISDPIFQYASIGISFFLFLVYPSFFIVEFNQFIFQFISYFFVILGVFNFCINLHYLKKIFNKILFIFKNKNYLLIYVLVFVFLLGESGSSELLLVLYISYNNSFDTFFAFSYILLVSSKNVIIIMLL